MLRSGATLRARRVVHNRTVHCGVSVVLATGVHKPVTARRVSTAPEGTMLRPHGDRCLWRDPGALRDRAGMRTPAFPQIEGQCGLATRTQLTAAGFTRAAVRHAAKRDWQQVRPGVYAAHRGPLDAEARLAAAALWSGPHAVLTASVALHRHGLEQAATDEALFLVPATARSRQDGRVRTVRTSRPVRVALQLGCVMVASVERSLVDLANHGSTSADDLKALTLSILQRRQTTCERLEAELRAAPRTGTEPVRRAVELFARGAWSMPEAAFGDLAAQAPDLPTMRQNVTLRTPDGELLGTPDGFFPDAGVAVQVHSRQFHSGYAEDGTDLWSATVEGDGVYAEQDVICIGITPRSIHQRPEQTLERIRTVVLRNVGRAYGPVLVDGQLYGESVAS